MVTLYKTFKPFSDAEAWLLLKLAAFGEAVGWSLLIAGIAAKRLPVSWHDLPVLVTGQIHGTLFIIYIAAVFILGPSLGWSLPRTVFAGLCSVPPYGSLLYEQWSARHRIQADSTRFYRVICYHKTMQLFLMRPA